MPKTFLGKFWAYRYPFGQNLGMKSLGDPSEFPIRQRLPDTVSRSLMMPRRRPTDRSSRQSRMSRFLQQRNGAVPRPSRQSHQREKDDTQLPLPIEPAIPRNRHKPLGSRDILCKSGMATALLAPECARPSRNRACSTLNVHYDLQDLPPLRIKAIPFNNERMRFLSKEDRDRLIATYSPHIQPIDHFRHDDPIPSGSLNQRQSLSHPFIIEELPLSRLRQRNLILEALRGCRRL